MAADFVGAARSLKWCLFEFGRMKSWTSIYIFLFSLLTPLTILFWFHEAAIIKKKKIQFSRGPQPFSGLLCTVTLCRRRITGRSLFWLCCINWCWKSARLELMHAQRTSRPLGKGWRFQSAWTQPLNSQPDSQPSCVFHLSQPLFSSLYDRDRES